MRKMILLIFMLFSISIYSARYEYKENIMYENGKKATGTFLLKSAEYSIRGKFIDGLPDEIFERYYLNGKLAVKYFFVKGECRRTEIYYKNGNLMLVTADDEESIYFNNGKIAINFLDKEIEGTEEGVTIYHENGKPLVIYKDKYENDQVTELAEIYNEKNKILYSGEKNKFKSKSKIQEYFYSTGELMYRYNDSIKAVEIFYKNGVPFIEQDANKTVVYYRNRKSLYKLTEELEVYDEDGKKIPLNIGNVRSILKIK